MKTHLIYIDYDSEPTTLLRVDSLKVNKNLSLFIQIKIISTNKVVPKMSVWRHVNIGTIDNGQNICPIYTIKVGQQFCEMSLYENTEE